MGFVSCNARNLPGGQPEVVTYNNCKQTELPSQQAPAEVVGVSSDNLSPIEQVAEEQTGGRSKKRRRRRRRSRRGKKNSRRSRKASRNGGGIFDIFKKFIGIGSKKPCKFPFYDFKDSNDPRCDLLKIMNDIYEDNKHLEKELKDENNLDGLYNIIKGELELDINDPGLINEWPNQHKKNTNNFEKLESAYKKYKETQETQTPAAEPVESAEPAVVESAEPTVVEEVGGVGGTRLNELKQQIGGAKNVQEIVEMLKKFEKEKTQKAGKRNKKSNRRKRKGKRKLRTSRKRTLKNKRRRKSRRRQQGGYNYDCPSCNMSGRDFGCKQPLWNSKCI